MKKIIGLLSFVFVISTVLTFVDGYINGSMSDALQSILLIAAASVAFYFWYKFEGKRVAQGKEPLMVVPFKKEYLNDREKFFTDRMWGYVYEALFVGAVFAIGSRSGALLYGIPKFMQFFSVAYIIGCLGTETQLVKSL
ncbi:MAG: hypothetical protein R3Y45_06550 [Bacillota bacterium]